MHEEFDTTHGAYESRDTQNILRLKSNQGAGKMIRFALLVFASLFHLYSFSYAADPPGEAVSYKGIDKSSNQLHSKGVEKDRRRP